MRARFFNGKSVENVLKGLLQNSNAYEVHSDSRWNVLELDMTNACCFLPPWRRPRLDNGKCRETWRRGRKGVRGGKGKRCGSVG
jgi:hypothetical protein